MLDTEAIRDLYDYNAWANQRALEACAPLSGDQFMKDLGSSFRSVRDTLAHIYGAEWLWLERWQGRMPMALPVPADFPDFPSVAARIEETDEKLMEFAAAQSAADLARAFEVRTTAGGIYRQPLWQMMQHLTNHSTYHRGQVTTLLRQLGGKPVQTDLILFYRQRLARAAS
ncbi:MAG: DinB family protein [Candidatus Acidiferrales bacterium]